MENPIKDNRFVADITFATRLKQFLESYKEISFKTYQDYQEYWYLLKIADELQKYQILTATQQEELEYFKML